jgi:hypothetical protein
VEVEKGVWLSCKSTDWMAINLTLVNITLKNGEEGTSVSSNEQTHFSPALPH